MWNLIKAQVNYHRKFIFLTILTTVVLHSVVAWRLQESEKNLKILTAVSIALLFAGSLILLFMIWTRDLKERRLLFFLSFPLPRWQIGCAYLLVPFFLQLSMMIVTTLPLLAWVAVAQELEAAQWQLSFMRLIGTSGWVLAFFFFSYLFAEVSIALSYSKTLVYGANIVLAIFFLSTATMDIDYFEWLETSSGVVWGFTVAFFFFTSALVMFLYRKNYMMGIHPVHGLPQDWSESSAS